MALTIIIFLISIIGMIICSLFFPTIKIGKFNFQTYYFFPLIGAIILIATSCLDINSFWQGLTNNSSINPLKILAIFLSMSFLSIVLDEMGFFRYLALKSIKYAKGSQFKLFVVLYILISILTIFTSNDIIVLTFTPFIIFYAKNAKINPIPYLIMEFVAANTWSMFLIIGNPTNIYIASYLNVDFFSYLKIMWLPTLMAGISSFIIMLVIFKRKLDEKMEISNVEDEKIKNKPFVIASVLVLLVTIILMAISNVTHIEMYIVSLVAAGIDLIILIITKILYKKDNQALNNSFKRLPYTIIPFIISMFAIVLALGKQGVTLELAKFMANMEPTFGYGFISFISCNLLNNIPMSVLFSSIIEQSSVITNNAIFATIIGSNLGAFLTPLGALAGIMFLSNLKRENIKLTYPKFSLYGVIIAIPTIAVSLASLYLILI